MFSKWIFLLMGILIYSFIYSFIRGYRLTFDIEDISKDFPEPVKLDFGFFILNKLHDGTYDGCIFYVMYKTTSFSISLNNKNYKNPPVTRETLYKMGFSDVSIDNMLKEGRITSKIENGEEVFTNLKGLL